jgi:hypothetical protein
MLRWQDEVQIPALIACEGVAGAWTFAADELFKAPWDHGRKSWSFADQASRIANPQPQRLQILYLDSEPAETMARVGRCEDRLRHDGLWRDTSASEDILFMSPLRAIVAWQWDWFN